MKIVFLGTPDFAVPSLRVLHEAEDMEVVAVVTQPDKAVGRKKIITAPAIKVAAQKFGIKVLQPEKISSDESVLAELQSLGADVMVTVAYGQILKPNVLDLCPRGVINLHGSLLPKYRGPAPISWMIINGETQVGVMTMQTNAGVDTGEMLAKFETHLGENETAAELAERLSDFGADLLLETLRALPRSKRKPQEYQGVIVSLEDLVAGADLTWWQQPDLDVDFRTAADKFLLAPFMDRKLGEIDWQSDELVLRSANPKQVEFEIRKPNTAQNIHNLVRGLYPWPGAYFIHKAKKVAVLETQLPELSVEQLTDFDLREVGDFVVLTQDTVVVKCQEGFVELLTVKPESKKAMPAAAWARGL